MSKFVITGLPRSRTAWFAAYLTCGDVMCYHEAIPNNNQLSANTGTADCGYALCPDWVESIGRHKLVIIHRDCKEVAESMARIGLPDTTGYLPDLDRKLQKLNGLHVDFEDIDMRLEEIHNYLDLPYDKKRAELFSGMNIQSNRWRN